MSPRVLGRCPGCNRHLAITTDGVIARPHNGRDGRECDGYGMEAGPIKFEDLHKVKVSKNPVSKRWRVVARNKFRGHWHTWQEALAVAIELAAELRREHLLALTRERFGLPAGGEP